MPDKKNSINDMLKKKGPLALRQPINPINIIETAAQETERDNRTENETKIPSKDTIENKESNTASELPIDKADGKTVDNTSLRIASEEVAEKNVQATSSEKPTYNIYEEIPIKKREEKGERKKRSSSTRAKVNRNTRSKKPRIYSEKNIQALLAVDKRETVRYSFEAYVDQKEDVERVCDLYEEATGKKLSASRLMRELLDSFLPGAIKTFDQSDE